MPKNDLKNKNQPISKKRTFTPKNPVENIIITKTQKVSEEVKIIVINKQIKTLDDLIEIAGLYEEGKKYNINLEKLNKILPILKKLNEVIGMTSVKNSIIGHIIFFLQDFQNKNEDMLHTVIQGPPGVGKTLLGHIIGQIYWELDIIQSPTKVVPVQAPVRDCCDDDDDDIDDYDDYDDDDDYDPKEPDNKDKNGIRHFHDIIRKLQNTYGNKSACTPPTKEFKFKIVKRSDLIGKYLGHTAAKTQEVIDSALGGVLFIDEAYSLGNPEGRDSFAKECIDTINQNLTEKKNQILVIIAGYQESLDTCFFAYNEGLNRRFPFRYTIESYTAEELGKIFLKMVSEINPDIENKWISNIEETDLNIFFKENHKSFPNFGGDIETFLLIVKIQHSIRVFCLESQVKKIITIEDLKNALKIYKLNKEIKDKDVISKYLHNSMYV